MEKLYEQIPSLDLNDLKNGDIVQKSEFVKKLGEAYENIGFVAIKNHGLSDKQVEALYSSVQEFFELPDNLKSKYEKESLAGQRGYIGKGKEHAKGRSIGDLKEFFHVGQPLAGEEYPENIWPNEVTDFKDNMLDTYSILEDAGLNMLRAIALYLGLEEKYFDDKVKGGNSILRSIHYFPIDPSTTAPGAVRAAEHGDINLITLLMGASADGLQVLRKDGKWIPITALPDQIVVNVGDMLERFTNKKLKSTIHRVVNPPKELLNSSRYSIPFFMHPRSDMDLSCHESCVDDDNPKQFEDITAGRFLEERLKEIGLKN